MNIIVNKELLLKAVNTADSIISSKSINTVLANCLLKVGKDGIEIISTDNEIAIRTKIAAQSDSIKSFTLNGKKLASILKELPNDDVALNLNDSYQISIKSKSKDLKGSYTLIGSTSDDYPDIPKFNDSKAVEIDQSIFKEMIKKVMYAASFETVKPVFNGIFMTYDNSGFMTTVATDSRRLSFVKRAVKNNLDIGEGIILPLKTVHEIYKLLGSSGTTLFSVNSNQCFVRIGNTEIVSRIVDGQFPNYKQVIPREYSANAVIETKKLADSVKRVMIFTREPSNKIVLHFMKNTLKIEANTPELGEAEEEIFIESDSKENLSIGINAQFLLDSLKEIDTSTLRCGITGVMSPLTIIPVNDENYISVIMPIQIKSSQND